METELSHEEIEELLGAYALDALPGEERDLVERHLRDCTRCRQEVAEHREAAALLALGAPAPGGLWDRISGAIAGKPPEKQLVPVLRPRPARAGWAVAAAVATLAAAVTGFMGLRLAQQGDQIDELQEAVETQGLDSVVSAALADPSSVDVPLVAEEGSTLATVVLLPDGKGYLFRPLLPPLPENRTYQLWALVGKATVSAGVLGNRPGVTAFSVDMPVNGFAISEEMHGGVAAPQSPPIAVGMVEAN
jgi:anti-sigma-K factor RskA